MSILVLGATGFVGTNICNLLQESALQYMPVSLSTGVDLRKVNEVVELLKINKPSIIINCAAHVGGLNFVNQWAADIITDNSKMILTLYEAACKVCSEAIIINPLGSCTYPGNLGNLVEEKWHDGQVHQSVFSYGSVRRFTWAMSECYRMQYNIRTISLIVNNMYGPNDSTDPNKAHALNALVSKFVKAQIIGQEEIEVWGTGSAIREWTYVKDFARIVVQICEDFHLREVLLESFNIGQKFGLSIKELVQIIYKKTSYSGRISFNTEKPDGAPEKIMDDRKFRCFFPDFEFTNLDDGISETINYYKGIYPY
jgi:GDP-L-fucose synthase